MSAFAGPAPLTRATDPNKATTPAANTGPASSIRTTPEQQAQWREEWQRRKASIGVGIPRAERIVNEQVAAACQLSAVPGGSGHFATPAEALAAVGHLRR